MHKHRFVIFGVLIVNVLMKAEMGEAAKLQLKITDVRSARGQILIAVFKDAEAFPRKPESALVKRSVPAKEGQNTLELEDLEPGDYAIALHHDEDSDTKMAFNFVGIPREGFGFSGNKRIYFGPPSFKNAKLTVADPKTDVEIKMKYF